MIRLIPIRNANYQSEKKKSEVDRIRCDYDYNKAFQTTYNHNTSTNLEKSIDNSGAINTNTNLSSLRPGLY